ncbi:hypothetical protein LTR78_007433 [Recurvomyces mirabilis]|uniref:Uncharacterized protein n=1 Tax=Recurvomyces mirabilis TaxID=574656 RepID=A0AAE0WHE0_9PEZI|nr:hypothetical protein LTR78_007433 [Recurvomyces mirabilis]KAK5160058.1 hypothetical protein LTS14_002164 [Recurvomyces mirabilis]
MSSSQTRFEAIQNRSDTIVVPMNQAGHCTWDRRRYLATQQLNGCTALALVSSEAGILVHIAPINPNLHGKDAPGNAELDNARGLLQQVITVYNTYTRMGVFPDPSAITVLAIHEGRVAVPVHIKLIQGILTHLSIPSTVHQYGTKQGGEARSESDNSVVVEGEKGRPPKLYINGNELKIPARSATALAPDTVPAVGRAVQVRSVPVADSPATQSMQDSRQTQQHIAALMRLYSQVGYSEQHARGLVETRAQQAANTHQLSRAEAIKQLYEYSLAQSR